MNRAIALSMLILSIVLVTACAATHGSGPYEPASEALRDTAKAQRLNQEAAPLIHSDPAKAERLLREALTSDLYFGPAHNNLGVLYLSQGMLYEAAGEFEWARKLMPGHPDPRMNLALVLEKAGRTDEALTTYAAALEVYPNHIPTIQALARLQVRSGHTDERTAGFLDEIALRGETETWRTWARNQRIRLGP
jgi:Tfp pilus assembly protein PilF